MPSGGLKRLSSFGLAGVVFVAAYAGVVACSTTETSYIDEPEEPNNSTDAGFDSKPSSNSGLGILTFMPADSYSGYDGTHAYIVPVAIYDSGDDLEVTASDPSSVEIVRKELANPSPNGSVDSGKYFFVNVKKGGKVTLTATSNGKSVSSAITVTEYTTQRWEAGEQRYKNGSATNPPCTDCHVNGAAIDHSPAALATATDEEIAVVITTGISTHGFPIRTNTEQGHRWTVTDEELDGLVTYLRSLAPRGFK